MRIGSLFSGIGGLELGLERAGLGPVLWQAERDPFCRRVLEKHWPEATRLEDVRGVNCETVEPVEIVCGGFPCQDLSHAGRRAGLAGDRSGLWREFARIVDELQPACVVVENVHHAWRSWLPFVRADLAELGYASVPIRVSAAEAGADHERRRVFVVAHADGELVRDVAEWVQGSRERRNLPRSWEAEPFDTRWRTPASRMARIDDGIPERLDGATRRTTRPFSRWSEDRRRALGNAVVPACAEVIGRAIMEAIR